MLVGYVSNEQYEALPGVYVLLQSTESNVQHAVRSTAKGTIHADLDPGEYEVTLQKDGYGGKVTTVSVDKEEPIHFRLLSSDLMTGFVWPKWVTEAEEGRYNIHTPETVQLTLWRYGYEKEFIKNVDYCGANSGLSPQRPLLPDDDFTQQGVSWSSDGKYDTSVVQAPSNSGLYYFHMNGKGGEFHSFPWVVAPESPTNDIAVLASTNTWGAYNSFGGRGNYRYPAGLPSEPIVYPDDDALTGIEDWKRWENHEFAPLSFKRPNPSLHVPENKEVTDPITTGNHVAQGEWRLLGWLEREGYKYDFYADQHLHDNTLPLDEYKILVISTHPEYWSSRMYSRVKEWVEDRGGCLMYLGGNGINCEVTYLNDSRMHIPTSSENVNEETHPTDIQMDYESRFHRTVEAEGSLLGVATTTTGYHTSAPYEVLDASHWIFEGTGLSTGDLIGETTLHELGVFGNGASGHETDKQSGYAPDEAVVLAKGTNPNDGGGEMVVYDTESDGGVFSVGSILYPGSLLVDEPTSMITQNVIDEYLSRP